MKLNKIIPAKELLRTCFPKLLKFVRLNFIVYLHLKIVPWCNGSTADFGSACLGSNPGGTAYTN